MLFPLYDHNKHHRIPWLTGLIILANMVVMVWLGRQDPQTAQRACIRYGFVPERLSQLDKGQPVVVEFERPKDIWNPGAGGEKLVEKLPADPRQVYQSLITMMFLHGGWLHLITNMWMLWVFGNNIEDRLGHIMFLVFYLLGGLTGSLAHWAVEPHSTMPVIGASGAVAAVLGGYAVSYPTAKVRTLVFVGMVFVFDLPALLVLGIWFLMEMVQGLGMLKGIVNMPVAFWAHIGGFVAGLILIPIFGLGASPAESDWQAEADEAFRFDEMSR